MNGRELNFIIPYLCVRFTKIKIKGKSLNFKHKNNSLSLRYLKKAHNKP
jgi:hypothetical protein